MYPSLRVPTVREASSVNNVLQINSRDIEDEVARIVAKQRKVSPEFSGTTKALDADDPRGDGLQVSVGINLFAHAAANPQPPPLVAGQVEVNEAASANPQPLPLVAVGIEVNEAAVVTTENYFLFRMGVTVVPSPKNCDTCPYPQTRDTTFTQMNNGVSQRL